MYLMFLVEDGSGEAALRSLVPRVMDGFSYNAHFKHFKGIGRLPPNLKSAKGIDSQQLLDNLPAFFAAYGKLFASMAGVPAALIVVCDLDGECMRDFRAKFWAAHTAAPVKPGNTFFCISIEEMEAWLLGDRNAVKKAYPNVKKPVLDGYQNDSICGTWEKLADAVHSGGAKALKGEPYFVIGRQKSEWAERIAPHIDVENNSSPSFQYFRDKIRAFAREAAQ